MSEYPPAPPYGAFGNHPPQTNPAHLQSQYPSQYMQQDDGRAAHPHMVSDYNASAYAYNNAVPGFNAGSGDPAAHALPIYQGWNQGAVTVPSYSAPQSNMPYTGYAANSYQATYAPDPHTHQPNTQHVAPYDEGELSEGEFDTYGGQNNNGAAPALYGSNYYQGNEGTGYINTVQRPVYFNGQDYNNLHDPSSNGYNNYQRESASYSPYEALPLEAVQDESFKGKQNNTQVYPPATSPGRPMNGMPWLQSSTQPISHSLPVDNTMKHAHPAGNNPPHPLQLASPAQYDPQLRGGHASTAFASMPQPKSTAEVANQEINTILNPTIDQNTAAVQTKSVAEYRKKAEAAILALWPREVRFPDYVKEGFDPIIVGRLFDDLGFSRAPKAPVAESKSANGTPNLEAPEKMSADLVEGVELSSRMADPRRSILVESNSNNKSTSKVAPSTALAESEATEKEKNLKMKMEALRKSRAERAQKAAAKNHVQSPAYASTALQPKSSSAKPNPLATSPLPPSVQPTNEFKSPNDILSPNDVQSPNKLHLSSSIAQTIPPQPTIPGLFLATTSSPAPFLALSSNITVGSTPSNQRKRPVAADFDTPASSMPHKRPFGQSRNDSLVIDVSEEEPDSEDEDTAMDLESQADQDSPLQAARKMSDQRTAALQDFPPLTNFPSRRAFMSPPISSSPSTPLVAPVVRTTLTQPQDLQQTEKKIEELKKKIAAAEAAKAAKRRAQHTSSGAVTPQLQPINGTSATNGDGDIASKVHASLQMQQLIDAADDKVASDQKKLAETHAAELAKAAELKSNEAESRRLRRERIATDLPRVDAEVEESQRKLEELREAMAKIEASVRKSLDEKSRMAEEMERLGQEAEDQLQEQKYKLKILINGEIASTSGPPASNSFPPTRTNAELARRPSRAIVSSSGVESTSPIGLSASSNKAGTLNPVFGTLNERPANSADDDAIHPIQIVVGLASTAEGRRLHLGNLAYGATEEDLRSFLKGYSIESISIAKSRNGRPAGFGFVDVCTQAEAERAIAELSGKKFLDREISVELARKPEHIGKKAEAASGGRIARRFSIDGADMASSASDQNVEASLHEHASAEAETHEQRIEDIEIGESESHGPDHAQSGPESGPRSDVEDSGLVPIVSASVNNGDIPAGQTLNVQLASTKSTEINEADENDDYEPPDATPPIDIPSSVDSPTFSPAPPESVINFQHLLLDRGGLENTAENDEQELQVNACSAIDEPADTSNQTQFFTPYESPLKYFRAFRFHSDFKQQVSGGLKSVTYSHRINPNLEFCRYELAGGVCNDKTCEFQHFRDIALPDDTILSTLGTPEEFPPQQQQKFREGLRQVLTNLRSRKVQDFDTIAAEVLAHRSKFLNDPSKILMLEGTTI